MNTIGAKMRFFDFLNYAVTPYHTVDFLRNEFCHAGFDFSGKNGQKLNLDGAYLVERGGALIAFRTPKTISSTTRIRLALAHTDFPVLKVTPKPDKMNAGVSTLHTEVYGSPLYTSWLDRDLGYAGLLAFEKDGALQTKLVRGGKLFRIPQLAVHLNRNVNQDGLKLNPQTDFDALWSAAGVNPKNFVDALKNELQTNEKLLDFDIQLFDAQSANSGGFNDEWVYSGRLDNLSSCHAIAEAILNSQNDDKDICVAAFLNNEEVGSTSRDGAAGNFLKSTLEEIWTSLRGQVNLSAVLAESFALSVDMAHAEHPNHPEKHESNHAPVLGGGVVLKMNSQKRYASDVFSSARLRQLCERACVPLQEFVMRNDMPCGSTVGPVISASLGIPTVDIGEPMLSMHSIREMTAIKDHQDMISLVKTLFAVKLT